MLLEVKPPHVKHISVRPKCGVCAQTTAGCAPQGSTLGQWHTTAALAGKDTQHCFVLHH